MKKSLLVLFVLTLSNVCVCWGQNEADVYFTATTDEGIAVGYCIPAWSTDYCYVSGTEKGGWTYNTAISTTTQGSLTIPERVYYNGSYYGVTHIRMEAFMDCDKLTSVTLPESVVAISRSSFAGCRGLKSISLPKKATYGYFYTDDRTFLIDESSFSLCTSLTEIALPEGVKELPYSVFSGCYGLKEVTLPSTLTSIAYGVFNGCYNLSTVTIKAAIPPTIESDAFDDCSNITLYVPKGSKAAYEAADYWKDFKEIKEDASLHIISFADANVKQLCVTNWDTNGDGELDEGEAAAVTDLGEVFKWIPDVNETPYDIQSFNELRYFTGLTAIGEAAFNSCGYLASITLPNSITSIGEGAFYGCRSLTSITIPDRVTSIGGRAFCECNRLASVTIPASVSIIYGNPFGSCTKLSSITVADDNPYYDSREGCNAIIRTSSNTLITGCKTSVIPNTVKAIGYGAFNKCTELSSIMIPAAVTTIGDEAFYLCTNLESLTITNGVQSIGARAFYGCKKINSLTIPASVTIIKEAAFQGCSGMSTIIVASGNSIYDSRGDCNAIIRTEDNNLIWGSQNTVIPNDVTGIGPNAFGSLPNITSVDIPESVTSIGAWAFSNCTDLASVTIPSGVTSIGQAAFYGCNSLKTVKSKIAVPFFIAEMVFQYYNSTTRKTEFTPAKLLVPYGCKETYETTDNWNKFSVIEEGGKCATPTISFIGGKLHFESETEGVEYHANITTPDSKDLIGNDIAVPLTYTIKVYASKADYEDSDVATQEINVRGLKGDVNEDGKVTITDAVGVVDIILNAGK